MKSPFSFCIVERGCLSLFALVFFHGIYMLFGSFERADFIECLSESSRKRTPRVRYAVPLGSDVADPRGTVFMQNVWKWAQKSFKESVAAMVIAEGIQICGTRRGIRVPF